MFKNGPKLLKLSEAYLKGKKIIEYQPQYQNKISTNKVVYPYEAEIRTEFKSLLNCCPFFTVETPKGLIVEAKVLHSDSEHTIFDFDWKFLASISTINDDSILEKGSIVKLLLKDTEMVEKFYEDPYITSCQAGVELVSIIQSPSDLKKVSITSTSREDQKASTSFDENTVDKIDLDDYIKNETEDTIVDLEFTNETLNYIDNDYQKKNKSEVEKILSNFHNATKMDRINLQKMKNIFEENAGKIPTSDNKDASHFSHSIPSDANNIKTIEKIMDYFDDDVNNKNSK